MFLRGGLGNILFQISAALHIQRLTQAQINIVTQFSEPFLDPVSTLFVQKLIQQLQMQEAPNRNLPHAFELGVARAFGIRILSDKNFPPRLLGRSNIASDLILSGYFQSWSFLDNEICQVAVVTKSLLEAEFGKEFGPKTGAIHLRLGDYSTLRRIYGCISPEYVIHALQKLRANSSIHTSAINVFTNDPSMAKQILFDLPEEFAYIENLSATEALWDLSNSAWLVGSNSTFSWWGAALGGFIPITLPYPFFVRKRLNSRIQLDSPNVTWINREHD